MKTKTILVLSTPRVVKTLLSKTYSGESIVDVERDIYDAVNEDVAPCDKHGFALGTYRLVLTFEAAQVSRKAGEP